VPIGRKRRFSLALPIAALSITLPLPCLRAGDSWEKKPYTEWTAAEAQKVLTDSPWSKVAIVQELRSAAAASTPIALSKPTQVGEHCPTCGQKGDEGAATETAAFSAGTGWGSATVSQVVYFRVIFFSSTRIRQALARLDQLSGKTTPSQSADQLKGPLADYVIALAGPYVGAFQGASLDDLRASTYLRPKKKGGVKLELKGFIAPQALTDGMALFFFPRGGEGKPPFDAADGQAEFATGEGRSQIKVSFKIDKMW